MPIPSFVQEQRAREVQQALRLLCALPLVKPADVHDDSCPICLVPFNSIFEEHESAEEKQEGASTLSDSSVPEEMTGVVKLSLCGHIFCRKDLADWIKSFHGSCPACRQTFFAFTPIDEAEYESSDGGEYVPGEDDEDDDAFTDDGDLIPSSDIDISVDWEDGEVDMPRLRLGSSGFWVASRNVEYDDSDIDIDIDELDAEDEDEDENEGAQSESGGLSYGSDSLSSEGASVSTEDGNEEDLADVNMVPDGVDEVAPRTDGAHTESSLSRTI
ncbi:hypothetical protein DFH11DRAFT_661240 [Phellopilus nigrolimitatus]|nr:hypothetical protein DFH11DRAFT_661240 [Phellopilus nigrolimitatus]